MSSELAPVRQRLASEQVESSARGLDDLRAVFDARSASTIGLEQEVMLLEPDTLEVVRSVGPALDALAGDSRFAPGSSEGQLEIRTPVCGNAVAAALCLADAILHLDRVAGRLLVVASGTHPLHAAHSVLPSGLHVHVRVSGSDRALAVYNAARSFLPELTALAANSPFLDGEDTGLASSRSQLMLAFRRAGVPPALPDWESYVELLEQGERGGSRWDIRLQPRFGTVELRCLDSPTRVDDAAAVTALFQCLVAWLASRYDDGLPVHDANRVAENLWRASRDGAHGHMVDPHSGEREETRLRIRRLLEALEPTAAGYGTSWALLTAGTLLVDNGADRQRYVAAQHGLHGLVRWLAAETVGSAKEYLERRT